MDLDKIIFELMGECFFVAGDDDKYILKCPLKTMYLIILPYYGSARIIKTLPNDYLTITNNGLLAIQRRLKRIKIDNIEWFEDLVYSEIEYNPFKIYDENAEAKKKREKKECLFLYQKGFTVNQIYDKLNLSKSKIKKHLGIK